MKKSIHPLMVFLKKKSNLEGRKWQNYKNKQMFNNKIKRLKSNKYKVQKEVLTI